MIESLFIVFLIIATCAFLAGFTTAKKNLRMFLLASAFMLLGCLGFAALNLEYVEGQQFCETKINETHVDPEYTAGKVSNETVHYHYKEICIDNVVQDWAVAYISWGYSLIALLALIVTSIQAYDPRDGTLL